jgi:hypothetical protein
MCHVSEDANFLENLPEISNPVINIGEFYVFVGEWKSWV